MNGDGGFSEDCFNKLKDILDIPSEQADEEAVPTSTRHERLQWVIIVTDHAATHTLHLGLVERLSLARELASEWPTFRSVRLIGVVRDVVNAKVVRVQDVKDIQSDEKFWDAMDLLWFLCCPRPRTHRL